MTVAYPEYPAPPWHTHGRAFAQPYLVDKRSLTLPPGFEPVAVAGRCVGILAFIEYLPPSPLAYGELVWMPCMVRTTATDGRTHRGYFVDRMYVDDEASLAAGRTEWALPKQLATFRVDDDRHRVTADTEDGAHLVLEVGARGPAVKAPVASGTLQDAGDHLVRFRGRGHATTSSGFVTVVESRGTAAWNGFASARRLPAVGIAMREFAITMLPPTKIDHAPS